MLKRIRLWVGIVSALLTGVVLVLTSTGLAGPGASGDGCQSACENFLTKCTSGSSSSSASWSSSSSSNSGPLGACVESCRGNASSSSSSSSSSASWTWSWVWPWSWTLSSSWSYSWLSSSSGQPIADLLTCIATAPTCPAIKLCGSPSVPDGSTVEATGGADGAVATTPSGSGGTSSPGTGGAGSVGSMVGTGGTASSTVVVGLGSGGSARATATGPVGSGGLLGPDTSSDAIGTGGAVGTSASAPSTSSPEISGGGCRVVGHEHGFGLAMLLLASVLFFRRPRSRR